MTTFPARMLRKHLLILLAGLLFILLPESTIHAQGCMEGLRLKTGGLMEYRTYKKRNKLHFIQRHQVQSIDTLGKSVTAHVKCGIFDHKQNLIRSFDYELSCADGVMSLDKVVLFNPKVLTIFENKDFKHEGQNILYPPGTVVGDSLPGADYTVHIVSGTVTFASLRTVIRDRTVKELTSVTTPAGTWPCTRIEYKLIQQNQGKDLKFNFTDRLTEWVSPGLGMVRQEVTGKGNLSSYTVLHSIQQ
jgi:hypothetical protein